MLIWWFEIPDGNSLNGVQIQKSAVTAPTNVLKNKIPPGKYGFWSLSTDQSQSIFSDSLMSCYYLHRWFLTRIVVIIQTIMSWTSHYSFYWLQYRKKVSLFYLKQKQKLTIEWFCKKKKRKKNIFQSNSFFGKSNNFLFHPTFTRY